MTLIQGSGENRGRVSVGLKVIIVICADFEILNFGLAMIKFNIFLVFFLIKISV